MNAPADLIRLTQFSHGGGCGCKIAPAVLSEILAKTPVRALPKELLVGIESSDDAAVYRLNDEQAIVATTDFFTPIVDDPYDFGRIAATNALSDVYAMGGKPIFALAIVGMPLEKMPVEVIQRIISGGESVCAQAGIPIAGGHSIDTLEPIYGLVAIGLVHPKKVKRNDRAKSGDVLILGKPLGVGILSAALKKGKLSASGYKQMVEVTTQLNTPGTALAELEDVHALTDVTGFGHAGHMPAGSPEWKRKLVSDPQTSGGLLVACAPTAEKRVIEEFLRQGFPRARRIGLMQAGAPTLSIT